jgi:hypothetical protein
MLEKKQFREERKNEKGNNSIKEVWEKKKFQQVEVFFNVGLECSSCAALRG